MKHQIWTWTTDTDIYTKAISQQKIFNKPHRTLIQKNNGGQSQTEGCEQLSVYPHKIEPKMLLHTYKFGKGLWM